MSINISDTLVAGGSFPIVSGTFVGSLTQVAAGVPFITVQGALTITTGSLGNLILSGGGAQGPAGTTGPAGTIFGSGIGQVANTFHVTTQGVLLVSTSVGSISISLPNATANANIIFKDVSGDASVNPFTVFPTGGALIDAVSASYPFYTNFGTLKVFSDGANWFTW